MPFLSISLLVHQTSFNLSLCNIFFFLQVDISIPTLPRLREQDLLLCVFGSFTTNAVVVNDSPVEVTCSLPKPLEIPATPDHQGEGIQVLLINTAEPE